MPKGISFWVTTVGDGVLDVPTENPASMGGFSEQLEDFYGFCAVESSDPFGASRRPPPTYYQERGS